MPNSCRTILKKAVHKGAITVNDMKKVERNLFRWIPVSDDLPSSEDNVLITDCGQWVDIGYYKDGEWFYAVDSKVHETPDVSAWGVLPEPWKGEDDG